MSEDAYVDGTLIAGADGKVYFIPAEELEEYRLPEDLGDAAKAALSGASGDEVEGYALGAVQHFSAYSGPLGVLPSQPIPVNSRPTLSITGFQLQGR